jgi:Ca2+-binding RTX toxin-like protein
MASVTAGAGHPLDMSVVHSYALSGQNAFFPFGLPSLFGQPVVPVYFSTSGGVVDVGATVFVLFPFINFPKPLTFIDVYATPGAAISGDLSYRVSGTVLPFQGGIVTVNFAALLNGNDAISGSSGEDRLLGFAGADSISGLAGNDVIVGGTGDDLVNGGDGNDTIDGGLGQDTVNGGLGNDQITMLVTSGNVDTLDAGADNDTLLLSGVVPGDHVVVVDLSSATDQVISIGGWLTP